MTPKIELRGVSKTFGAGVPVLNDVSFTIGPQEFVCLIGPSGCGKTTLLRVIDGLIPPDRGEVLIDDAASTGPGPRIGFVFQSFRLLPWRSVLDNVAFPMELQGVARAVRDTRAREYLRVVGLDALARSYPGQLSGGMQQRVGLARALSLEPEILLMDEPFAALDAQTREFMQLELSRICEERRLAVVFVTHSLDEALFLADRVILLRPKPGEVDLVVDVPLPRPRSRYDVRSEPAFRELRARLGGRLSAMVAGQPEFAHLSAARGPAVDGAA